MARQTKTIVTMLPAGSHVLECYNDENGIFRYHTVAAVLASCFYVLGDV